MRRTVLGQNFGGSCHISNLHEHDKGHPALEAGDYALSHGALHRQHSATIQKRKQKKKIEILTALSPRPNPKQLIYSARTTMIDAAARGKRERPAPHRSDAPGEACPRGRSELLMT